MAELNRRELLGLGALAAGLGALGGMAGAAEAGAASGEYELPKLPYGYDALAPALEEKILRLHHDKHHAGYVKGLNATLAALAKAREAGDLASISGLSRALAFHGSGHVLHALYWDSMRPGAATPPEGALKAALERDFGSTEKFLAHFAAAAKAVEGSGWAILVHEPLGKRLMILQVLNHQNLTVWGAAPLLVCDVWEHAYYLQYANDRGAYVDAFCKIVDWPGVAKRYAAATK
ncbi:MAG TPA: superoxide dismutase [Planctomycetota bacterium]|nr:superoxide dismutase [Planctomycetota bacterium]